MILGEDGIGEFIRQRRVNLGMTMSEACRRVGLSHPVWLRIERGETTEPRWTTIVAMLRALDTVVEVNFIPTDGQWLADSPLAPKERGLTPCTCVHVDP